MFLSGKVVAAAGVAGAMLIAALGYQTWRLNNEIAGRATAENGLQTCRALNAEHKAEINEINRQAERDIAEAQRQALLAEDAWRAALAHSARIARELATERGRLSAVPADDCLDQPVPADVDSLFREGADGPDGDGH